MFHYTVLSHCEEDIFSDVIVSDVDLSFFLKKGFPLPEDATFPPRIVDKVTIAKA